MASPPKQATARIRGRPDEKGDNVIAPAHSVSTMDATEPGSRLESETTVPPPQQSSVKAVSTLGSAVGSATSLKELPLFAKRTRNCFSTMPVTFVLLLISVLYSIFVGYHCIPNLQSEIEPDLRNTSKRNWAIADLIIYNIIFIMLLVCYFLSIVTPAGSIPDTPEWGVTGELTELHVHSLPLTAEVKRTGERRFCRRCEKYKPDRCHHCRVCRRCVLKMDHHCPWIYNCVGWGNHKYFLLLDGYSALAATYESLRLVTSVIEAIQQPLTPFGKMFLLVFGEILSVFLAIITIGFLGFHLMLTARAETTIEFSEKRGKENHPSGLYDLGTYKNFCAVLGPNPLLWFIPIDNRRGDGLTHCNETTRLLSNTDPKRGTTRSNTNVSH